MSGAAAPAASNMKILRDPVAASVEYRLMELMAKGAFGFVHMAERVDSSASPAEQQQQRRFFAVKLLRKDWVSCDEMDGDIPMEVTALNSLPPHIRIVQLEAFFQDDAAFYIVMDLCPRSTLATLMDRRMRSGLSIPEVIYFFRQACEALQHVHRHRIVHRDVKATNFCLTDEMGLKLVDFGLATRLESPGARLKKVCGTRTHMSPEMYSDDRAYSYEVDIWGLGCVLYQLLVGRLPFDGVGMSGLKNAIVAGEVIFPDALLLKNPSSSSAWPASASAAAVALVKSMLNKAPELRPTIDEVLKSPFLADADGKCPARLPVSCLVLAPRNEPDKSDPAAAISSVQFRLRYLLLTINKPISTISSSAVPADLCHQWQQQESAGLAPPFWVRNFRVCRGDSPELECFLLWDLSDGSIGLSSTDGVVILHSNRFHVQRVKPDKTEQYFTVLDDVPAELTGEMRVLLKLADEERITHSFGAAAAAAAGSKDDDAQSQSQSPAAGQAVAGRPSSISKRIRNEGDELARLPYVSHLSTAEKKFQLFVLSCGLVQATWVERGETVLLCHMTDSVTLIKDELRTGGKSGTWSSSSSSSSSWSTSTTYPLRVFDKYGCQDQPLWRERLSAVHACLMPNNRGAVSTYSRACQQLLLLMAGSGADDENHTPNNG